MIGSRGDILYMLDYFRKYPPMTHKLHRINMILEFYELMDQRAHKEPTGTVLYTRWVTFYNTWVTLYSTDIE
jgi:hypothetical protein